MALYFLIGLIYGLILAAINDHIIKEKNKEPHKFNAIAMFIAICAWPCFVILFFIYLFKDDEHSK
jgi:uncharacterized membrane protein